MTDKPKKETKPIDIPAPNLQMSLAGLLSSARRKVLQEALFETVSKIEVAELDKELATYAAPRGLSILAKNGLRGELVFPVPLVLRTKPSLLGYYRLLLGFSQKEFYGAEKSFGVSEFRSLETKNSISPKLGGRLPELCMSLGRSALFLLEDIEQKNQDPISHGLLKELSLLTLGAQFRGGINNQLGKDAIERVFNLIKGVVAHASPQINGKSLEFKNAANRKVIIEMASDPDIVIREVLSQSDVRTKIAVEVKGGTDFSNLHNRIGEAEKSHQKAKQKGCTECWTMINIRLTDTQLEHIKKESPSTDRFFVLQDLEEDSSEAYESFASCLYLETGLAAP